VKQSKTEKFLRNAANFKGIILVDNDCVFTSKGDENDEKSSFDFENMSPDKVLFIALRILGFKVESV
jgi:hypothetical protein